MAEFRNIYRREALMGRLRRGGVFYIRVPWAVWVLLACAALFAGLVLAAAFDVEVVVSVSVALGATWLAVLLVDLVAGRRARRPRPGPGPGGGGPAGDRSPRGPVPPGGSSAWALDPDIDDDEAVALGPGA